MPYSTAVHKLWSTEHSKPLTRAAFLKDWQSSIAWHRKGKGRDGRQSGNEQQRKRFRSYGSWARLSERVENKGKDLPDLRSNMNTGFQRLNAATKTLSNEVRGGSKTQWPIIIGFSSVTITIHPCRPGVSCAAAN